MSQGSTAASPPPRSSPTSGVVFVGRGALSPIVYERLAKALGDKRAGEVYCTAYERFGERLIETPQDMLDYAEILIRTGGLVQAVGRSLKVQALLRGAVET